VTLSRKGTRQITVDGVRYRWHLRGRPTYDQGLAWSPLTFVVELAEASGAVLMVEMDGAHPSNWISAPSANVTPVVVERAIRSALGQGWTPARPGPLHRLSFTASP
jgi:hypothetical protein